MLRADAASARRGRWEVLARCGSAATWHGRSARLPRAEEPSGDPRARKFAHRACARARAAMDVGHVLFESASAERLSAWRAFFAAEEEGWAAASARAGVGAENSGTAYALEHQEVYMRFVALVEGQLEELLAPHGATMRSLFEKLQAMRECHAAPDPPTHCHAACAPSLRASPFTPPREQARTTTRRPVPPRHSPLSSQCVLSLRHSRRRARPAPTSLLTRATDRAGAGGPCACPPTARAELPTAARRTYAEPRPQPCLGDVLGGEARLPVCGATHVEAVGRAEGRIGARAASRTVTPRLPCDCRCD